MATTWTTYTVLVTIAHEGPAPDWETVSRHIQQGLEEGTTDYPSVSAAAVDAFTGDRLDKEPRGPVTLSRGSVPAKAFHASFRNQP